MTALSNLFYFIIALGILVTIHEYGHFWVARKLGVRVLTFSVGFGKPLWKRISRDGVLYQIGMIPLGGYVKMLDEREAEVAEKDAHQAFNRKPVWVRIAIVAAGPIANFLLAIFLYWWVFGFGINGFNTKVGEVIPNSIAAKGDVRAGDLILEVDGAGVETQSQLIRRLALRLGHDGDLKLKVINQNKKRELSLPLANWKVDPSKPDILGALGIKHQIQVQKPLLDRVTEDGPAGKAGIQQGDVIVSVDGETVKYWNDLVRKVSAMPGKTVNISVERNGELLDYSVVIGSRQVNERDVGYLGVSSNNADLIVLRKGQSLWESFEISLKETWEMVYLSVRLFGKLLVGDLSLKSLSGPFKIAEGAGGSARIGLVYFLSFVAMVSVNLGFINLLPVPLLDGGHLMYYSIEAVRGKPLSEKVQEIGLQIGVLLVFSMMAIAIYNDLSQTIAP